MKNTRNSVLSLIVLSCLTFVAPNVHAAEPLALQKIMKDMGKSMQDITDGISREDWEMVEAASALIADHPEPPLFEKVRILSFVGSNMSKYKTYNAEIHNHAQGVGKAAKAGDGTSAVLSFRNLQTSCYNCHNDFRKPFSEHFYGKKDAVQ